MRSLATSSDSHNYLRRTRTNESKESSLMSTGSLPLLSLHDPNGWEECCCCCWPHLSQSRAEETVPTLRDVDTLLHMIPIPSSNKLMIHPFFSNNHGVTCSFAKEYAFLADSSGTNGWDSMKIDSGDGPVDIRPFVLRLEAKYILLYQIPFIRP